MALASVVYTVKSDGTDQVRLTISPAEDADPAWSPDGTKIAFTSARTGRRQAWVMNADGSSQTQLTNAANIGGENPSWSPNGRTIVFDSDRDEAGNLDVWVMNADGSAQKRLTDSPALDALPSYSPNGGFIVFASDRTAKDNREFFRMMANGGAQERLFRRSATVGTRRPIGAPTGDGGGASCAEPRLTRVVPRSRDDPCRRIDHAEGRCSSGQPP